MAKQLEDYTPPESGRPPSYPWHLWLNGSRWKIVKGVDFQCQMASMENLIRRTADSYGLKVTVSRPDKEEDIFVIQAREPEKELDEKETK